MRRGASNLGRPVRRSPCRPNGAARLDALAAQPFLDAAEEALAGRALVTGLGRLEFAEEVLLLSFDGVSTRMRVIRSPRPRPFNTLMPAPRWRSVSPDWMPAGILTSIFSPSMPGIAMHPPSAAVVKLIGASAIRVVPSRLKIAWRFK